MRWVGTIAAAIRPMHGRTRAALRSGRRWERRGRRRRGGGHPGTRDETRRRAPVTQTQTSPGDFAEARSVPSGPIRRRGVPAGNDSRVSGLGERLKAALRKRVRRAVVGGLGFSSLLAGLILLPLPTPLGIVFIPLGLMILAVEFPWARRTLESVERRTGRFGRGVRVARGRAQHIIERLLPWKSRDGDPDASAYTPGNEAADRE